MPTKKPPQEALEELARRITNLMERDGLKGGAELARRLTKIAGHEVTRQVVNKWVNAVAEPGPMNRRALGNLFRVEPSHFEIRYARATAAFEAPLSNTRVAPRFRRDDHNPQLVRVEMSEVVTIEQANKIAAIFGMEPMK